MGDRMVGCSMMGLLRMGIREGICWAEARLGSSLRRGDEVMRSVAVRDGLLDRNRWFGISTLSSGGEGVGDLEAGVSATDRAIVCAKSAKWPPSTTCRVLGGSNVRGEEWMATGDDRERCMDIIMVPWTVTEDFQTPGTLSTSLTAGGRQRGAKGTKTRALMDGK